MSGKGESPDMPARWGALGSIVRMWREGEAVLS